MFSFFRQLTNALHVCRKGSNKTAHHVNRKYVKAPKNAEGIDQ